MKNHFSSRPPLGRLRKKVLEKIAYRARRWIGGGHETDIRSAGRSSERPCPDEPSLIGLHADSACAPTGRSPRSHDAGASFDATRSTPGGGRTSPKSVFTA